MLRLLLMLQEVCNNQLLHLILKIIHLIGNFMSAGNGGAIGFQLDTLLKLKDVKSTRNKQVTLMHFIARWAGSGTVACSREGSGPA